MKKYIIAVVLGWMMVLFLHFDVFSSAAFMLQDKLTTHVRPVDPRIKIVAIDDESLNKEGSFPWPRSKMADLVDKLALDGATGIWLDVLLTEKTQEEEDQALAQVISQHDQVYLPVYFDFQVLQKSKEEIEQEYMKLPIIEIPQERLGHANLLMDSDNVMRRTLLGIPTLEEEIIPIIDVHLANLLLPKEKQISWDLDFKWLRGQEVIPIDERLQVGFSYATSPEDLKFDTTSAWKVMQGEIDANYFNNSIVLIGPFAPSLQDQFTTPMAKKQMYGVEVHANIVQALLDNALYTPMPKATALIIVVVFTMFGYMLFDWLRARWGAFWMVVLMVGYAVIFYYVFHSYGILIPLFYVLFGLIIAYIVAIGDRFLILKRSTHK